MVAYQIPGLTSKHLKIRKNNAKKMTKGNNFIENDRKAKITCLFFLSWIRVLHSSKVIRFKMRQELRRTCLRQKGLKSVKTTTSKHRTNPTYTSAYHKSTIYQISDKSNKGCRLAGTLFWTDDGRTYVRVRVISIVPLHLPTYISWQIEITLMWLHTWLTCWCLRNVSCWWNAWTAVLDREDHQKQSSLDYFWKIPSEIPWILIDLCMWPRS